MRIKIASIALYSARLSADEIAGRVIAAKGFDAGDAILRTAIREQVGSTVKRLHRSAAVLINEQILPANQLCKGAPWVIRADDLGLDSVRDAADARRLRHRPSVGLRQDALLL